MADKSKAERFLDTIRDGWDEEWLGTIFDEMRPEDVFRTLKLITAWVEGKGLPPEFRAFPVLDELSEKDTDLTRELSLEDIQAAFDIWLLEKVHKS
jgi:hypothetical protein